MVQSEWLTAKEVAEILQVSKSSVYGWANTTFKGMTITIAGTKRFHRPSIEAYLQSKLKESA